MDSRLNVYILGCLQPISFVSAHLGKKSFVICLIFQVGFFGGFFVFVFVFVFLFFVVVVVVVVFFFFFFWGGGLFALFCFVLCFFNRARNIDKKKR